MPMKNPMTPAGIEPATFRFVAQHLNHCATAVPSYDYVVSVIDQWISTEHWRIDTERGKPKALVEKTANLPTTKPTWIGLGPNPSSCGEKPTVNILIYRRARIVSWRWAFNIWSSTWNAAKISGSSEHVPTQVIFTYWRTPKLKTWS